MTRPTYWLIAVVLIGMTVFSSWRIFHAREVGGAPSAVPAPSSEVPRLAESQDTAIAPPPRVRSGSAVPHDVFERIRSLAARAYAGDAGSQNELAWELARCESALALVRKQRDPEGAIWNLGGGWTTPMKERAIAEFRRCARLREEDPFASLPGRDGGYTAMYWTRRAAEAGHPQAILELALPRLARALHDPDSQLATAASESAELRQTLSTVALSGNGDALLRMGHMIYLSDAPDLRRLGAAWMLAACREGADCGFDNRIVPFAECLDAGDPRCQPGMNVDLLFQATLSNDEFVRVDHLSRRISDALRNGDAQTLEGFLGF